MDGNIHTNEEFINAVNAIINSEDPTDRICISSFEQCCFIDEFCTKNLKKGDYFDFLCGHIPLPHIEIEIMPALHGNPSQKIEIMILTPNQIHFGVSTDNWVSKTAIGVARMDFMSKHTVGFLVKDDTYGIALASADVHLSDEEHTLCGELVSGYVTNYLGIQMCLLHPEYREILSTYKTVPISESGKRLSKKAAKRQRVARYVKYHVIDDNKITQCKQKRKFERKCQAWFVLGHWRQYKDGHRTFIQGYWKGPLREYKRNFDNVRIREVSKCN